MEPVQPVIKQSNFLVILLSVLLLISTLIAGVFAYQTQKLVKELTKLQIIPSPIATASPDPTADWKTYKNDLFGFELKYPSNLTLDTKGENLMDNIKKIKFINADGSLFADLFYNLGLSDSMTEFKLVQSINSYVTYEAIHPNGYPDSPTPFVVKDLRNSTNRIQFIFYNYSINTDIQTQILSTFKFINSQSFEVSSQKAVEIVLNFPEVKSFFGKIKNAKSTLDEGQSNDKFWIIHVYESFPDHNATFNWYKVDKTTGEATKQI